jgi:hypothetical protein
VKESILDIQLMNRPVLRQCQGKNHTNGCWLDHWTESLIIINTWTLSETPENPTSLVSIKRTIWMKLVPKNPLPGDQINTTRAVH